MYICVTYIDRLTQYLVRRAALVSDRTLHPQSSSSSDIHSPALKYKQTQGPMLLLKQVAKILH